MSEGIQAAKLQIDVESNALVVSGEVQQLNQSVKQAGTEGSANVGTLTKGFNLFQSEVLPAVAIVAGFGETIKKAWNFGEEGAQMEELETSAQTMATSLGGSLDEIVAKVKQSTNETIANEDIIQDVSKAMTMGMGADAEQLANLAEIAAARGRLMGETTTEAYDQIITGIGKLSPRMMENLGIIINDQEAYATYAANIGVAANALTDQEKRQALLNIVLADGNKLLQDQGGLIVDDATKYQQAEAEINNMKESLAEKTTPFWGDVAEGISGLLTYQDTLHGFFEQFSDDSVKAATTYQEYIAKALESVKDSGGTNQQRIDLYLQELATLDKLNAAGDTQSDVYKKTEAAINNSNIALARYGILSENAYEAARNQNAWLQSYNAFDFDNINKAADSLVQFDDSVTQMGIDHKLKDIYDAYNKSLTDLDTSQATLDEEYKAGKISLSDYNDQTEADKKSQMDLKTATDAQVKSMLFEQLSAGMTGQAFYDLAEKMGVMDDESYVAASAAAELKQEYDDGTISAGEYEQQAEDLASAIAMLKDKDITITTTYLNIEENVLAGNIAPAPPTTPMGANGLNLTVPGFAGGLNAIVPGGYSNDNYFLPMMVSSGENIQVIPPGQAPLQAGGGNTVINVYPANSPYTKEDLDRDIRHAKARRR